MSHDFPEPNDPVAYPPPAGTYEPASPVPYDELPATDLSTPSSDSGSTSDVAKEQAANVGQGAADAGKHVAGVAKEQASGVAAETSKQAKDLLSQTRTEVQSQAATQQDRIAASIRSLSSELGSMAHGSDQSGTATDLIRQASARADDIAAWLEQRDPGALVQEVTAFARRRPGAFLAIAAGAGLLAGRLTRGAIDAARDDDTPQVNSGTGSPATSYDTTTSWDTTTAPAEAVDPAYASTGTVETDPVWDAQERP